ncbi:VOC family protein [Mucilaginibacter segetis]|uniref:VOC domain-containing protein n=1 Tax=Mucilaginibacter segetis TaxID=2793071 RepID=A0A934PV26_9SPHI|nr:hypothetical protein [Mucilaginibacter segetis]MBK0379935.1 hypothetical protein [Mucilaginibacter segetis]
MEDKEPTFGKGKVCYIEIPANDITQSANFFSKVFNWSIRSDNQGNISFDDGVGEVSGIWVKDRNPMTEAGLLISIMVDDAKATVLEIEENGGK